MNFYMPIAADRETAENMWEFLRDLLKDEGRPVTRRRIRALVREHKDGDEEYIMVGGDLDDEEKAEDPILCIFEAKKRKRVFYLCPASVLRVGIKPMRMKLGKKWRVVEFDA